MLLLRVCDRRGALVIRGGLLVAIEDRAAVVAHSARGGLVAGAPSLLLLGRVEVVEEEVVVLNAVV